VNVIWQVALPPGPLGSGVHTQLLGVPNEPVAGTDVKSISPIGGCLEWLSASTAVQFVDVEICTVVGVQLSVVVVESTALTVSLPVEALWFGSPPYDPLRL
jgi:hypothetical protein